jgi:hypothetical protein
MRRIFLLGFLDKLSRKAECAGDLSGCANADHVVLAQENAQDLPGLVNFL